MKKFAALLFVLLVLIPLAAHAQNGCVDSPENPTLILGLVGGAAAAISCLRPRFIKKT
jgi:XrtJ-associated TM-motif-TM protein